MTILRLTACLFMILIFETQTPAKQAIPNKQNHYCIAFYNVENLYDTKNDPKIDDEDFLPTGPKKWDSKRYNQKIEQLAKVIANMAKDDFGLNPDLLGLAEIENESVIKDLIASPTLAPFDFGYVHYNSPDKRGIDVALIYKKSKFTVSNAKTYPTKLKENPTYKTRDQLLVSGKLNKVPVHIIVNHWPSRIGGVEKSSPLRINAAKLTRFIIDSLQQNLPQSQIIVMGDFNDDPTDLSIKKELITTNKITDRSSKSLYNPMTDIHASGIGTLCYRGVWNLFDQIILSQSFTATNSAGLKFVSAQVYNPPYLKESEGKYKGYPFRTYSGTKHLGGFSDHFPVYVIVKN